jgi:ABC-2 type transport system permease protein
MRETFAVFRKELRQLFYGPIPYVLLVVFSLFGSWWVLWNRAFLLMRQASLEPLFGILPWMMSFVVPMVSMRMWSEEIRGETMEPLLTAPVRVRHAVAGKYLAGLLVIACCLLSTVGILVTAAWLGDVDAGPVLGGYLGGLLLGGAYLAVGLWLSSKTRNQFVAVLVGFAVCFVWTLLDGLGSSAATGSFGAVVSQLSMSGRFRAIAQGVVDLRDVLFFASVIAFFLYLNVESVENRRYA